MDDDSNENMSDAVEEEKKVIVNPATLKLEKHDLSTVQDGEDHLPFSSKMDAALNFIGDALSENVYQFNRFGVKKSGNISSEEDKEERNIDDNRKKTKFKKEQKRLEDEGKHN